MPGLGELRLGSLAAESDDELFEYFVVTPIAETVMRQKIGLVLGRKGSGKTALFRQAEELLTRYGEPEVHVVRLNMDDHAWGAFRDFSKLGLSAEHAATVSWQLAILLQLSVSLIQLPPSIWKGQSIGDVAVLTQFIEDNFGELNPSLAKSTKLIGQVQGLKVAAFGAGLEAQFGGTAEPRELVPALTDTISQHLVAPLMDSGWLVLLDQLDESWDGSQEKKDLLVGLIKGVKRLNDDFGWRESPVQGVRAIAFLRTDIYESLAFDDKDKVRESVVEISWTNDQLREMVSERLGAAISLDSVFESSTSQKKGRIPKGSFNYLVSRTFLRPRDLLQFMRLLQNTFPGDERITKRLVEQAEPSYSRDKVDDLRQEYRRGAPWVDPALDALRQGPNKFESRGDLESRLNARISKSVLDENGMSLGALIEWMTETSILGAASRTAKTETIRFKYEGVPVSLEGDSTAWVHPALFQGLALTEPRVTRS